MPREDVTDILLHGEKAGYRMVSRISSAPDPGGHTIWAGILWDTNHGRVRVAFIS